MWDFKSARHVIKNLFLDYRLLASLCKAKSSMQSPSRALTFQGLFSDSSLNESWLWSFQKPFIVWYCCQKRWFFNRFDQEALWVWLNCDFAMRGRNLSFYASVMAICRWRASVWTTAAGLGRTAWVFMGVWGRSHWLLALVEDSHWYYHVWQLLIGILL